MSSTRTHRLVRVLLAALFMAVGSCLLPASAQAVDPTPTPTITAPVVAPTVAPTVSAEPAVVLVQLVPEQYDDLMLGGLAYLVVGLVGVLLLAVAAVRLLTR